MRIPYQVFLTLLVAAPVLHASDLPEEGWEPGNVIFIHPDGAGLGHWTAARLLDRGPDGMLHWDRLPVLSIYRSHQKRWPSTSSHAGATAHAFGKKVEMDSYGMDGDRPLTALSGEPVSVMREAGENGYRVGIVNSGYLAEPGTGVFLTSSDSRKKYAEIVAGLLESGAPLILGGGEIAFLPETVTGFHGVPGARIDGRNLVEEAEAYGYAVVYTLEQLLDLPDNTDKVLGLFAPMNTFNNGTEEKLRSAGKVAYPTDYPSVGEMTKEALRLLSQGGEAPFFLMVEEEGTDNLANARNASGTLEAVLRADAAIGVAQEFLQHHPETLLLVAADSDAGAPTVWLPRDIAEDTPLPATEDGGAPVDGAEGTGSPPFISAPDANGRSYPFGIAWPTSQDTPSTVVVRADGWNSQQIPANTDNTDIYRILYASLFGHLPGDE